MNKILVHIFMALFKSMALIMKRAMNVKRAMNIYEQDSCSYIHGSFLIYGSGFEKSPDCEKRILFIYSWLRPVILHIRPGETEWLEFSE